MMKFGCVLGCLAVVAHSSECPASWPQSSTCLWPFQQQYRNLSVATASDKSAACCSACAADSKCQEWSVQTGNGAKPHYKDVCILNSKPVRGSAPQDPSFGCTSGHPTVSQCPHGCVSNPQPPVPAPKGAKNVLFFAVDD